MTRPDIILSLYRASAELRKAQEAALREGRRDLADAIFRRGRAGAEAHRQVLHGAGGGGSGVVKKRISKRVREEAAVLCSIAACNEWEWTAICAPDSNTESGALAWQAERTAYAAWRSNPDWTPDTHWAEAEAMLRTGWSPS